MDLLDTYAIIMAKQRNQVDSILITLTTTPQVRRYLLQLVASGLYGKNAAETAERLVAQAINELIDRGKLRPEKNKQMERQAFTRTRG